MIGPSSIIPFQRVSVALLVLDVVGLAVLFNVSHRIELEEWLGILSLPLLVVVVLQVLVLYVLDLYSIDERSSRLELGTRTVVAVVVTGLIVAGLVYITKARDTERLFFRGVLASGLLMYLGWAILTRYLATIWKQRFARHLRWLVVSDVTHDSPLCRDIAAIKSTGETAVLVPGCQAAGRLPEAIRDSVSGSFADFDEAARKRWSGIIIASERTLPDKLLRRIMEMRLAGMRIYDLTDFYEHFMQKVPVLHLRDHWFALSHGFDLLHHNIQLRIKRLIDIMLAGVLFVLTLPVCLVIAIAIKLDRRSHSKGPILYRQLRTGANGREFYICKFRTMVKDAEAHGPQWAQHNDRRVTRIGRFLRASRLDEIPQLWNVLKGEMSFIGPRPERPDFNRKLEQVIPYYDLRHLIKPGITGWAQVMYEYGSSTEQALEKLQYDIYYIKNYSLLLDLFIVLKTLRVILGRRGR